MSGEYLVEMEVRRQLLNLHRQGFPEAEMLERLKAANPYTGVMRQRDYYNQFAAKQVALYSKSPLAWVKFCGVS